MKKLLNTIQIFAILTAGLPVFKQIYRLYYKISLKIIVKCFCGLPGIKSIYLKGSMATGKFVPGISDIDLLIVLNNMDASDEQVFLGKFWKRYALLKSFFPQLGHAEPFCEKEIDKDFLFDLFLNSSKFYKDLKSLKNVYGPYDLKFDELSSLVKEIPGPLSEAFFLFYDYIRLLLAFYEFDRSIHPDGYIKPLFRIIENYTHLAVSERNTHYQYRELLENIKLSKRVNKELVYDSFFDAIQLVNNGFRHYQACRISYRETQLKHSLYNFKPKTHAYVVKSMQPLVETAFGRPDNGIESILLSSVVGCNNSYMLFIILKDGLNIADFKYVAQSIKHRYLRAKSPAKKFFFVRISNRPVILTKNMLRVLPRINIHMSYFYLIKHATVLYGNDILREFPEISSINSLSISLFVSQLKDFLIYPTRNKAHIFDVCYGILPAIRLILDENIIATTPLEVYEEYRQKYAHETATEPLVRYHENFLVESNGSTSYDTKDTIEAYTFGKYCLKIIQNKY